MPAEPDPLRPPGEGTPTRPRQRLGVAALVLASLLASLAVGEVVVRLRYPALSNYRDFEPGIYVEDPVRRWANVPGYRGVYHSFFEDQAVAVNALGFRGPEVPAAAAAAPHRVLALGDSNTFGRGVGEAETYPAQLELELRRRAGAAVVWNSGVCGYDTGQELETLRRFGPSLRPDVVTLGWLENDIDGSAGPDARVVQGYLVNREEDVALLQERLHGRFWEVSHLQRLVNISLKIRRANRRVARYDPSVPIPLPPADRIEHNLAQLREVRRQSEELGARLLVIVYVGKRDVVAGQPTELVARTETALRSEGFQVLSAYELFRAEFERTGRDLFVIRDRGHPNGAGHGLTAHAVADWIDGSAATRPPAGAQSS